MSMLRRLLATLALAVPLLAAAAVPSVDDVYRAATQGHLDQAKSEIDQVLAAYPNSARAHYVDARVLALQGRWSEASGELAAARRPDPATAFAHADTLAAFQREVGRHVGAAAMPGPAGAGMAPQRHGFPLLGLLGGLLGVIAVVLLLRSLRASRQPPVQIVPPPGWQGPGPGPGAGAGYGGYPPQAPQGGGFLGAVGTGLGMGAGFAAGEMLVDKMFNHGGQSEQGGMVPPADAATPIPDDQDFGAGGGWTDAGGGDWGGGGGDDGSWS